MHGSLDHFKQMQNFQRQSPEVHVSSLLQISRTQNGLRKQRICWPSFWWGLGPFYGSPTSSHISMGKENRAFAPCTEMDFLKNDVYTAVDVSRTCSPSAIWIPWIPLESLLQIALPVSRACFSLNDNPNSFSRYLQTRISPCHHVLSSNET